MRIAFASLSPFLVSAWLLMAAACCSARAEDAKPVQVGGRLELLLDQGLIESRDGVAERIFRPTPGEVVLVLDKPWEGNTSAYFTFLFDGEKYRSYYRGAHWDTATKKATHREVTCYAESRDGVHWEKPELGLFEFDGSKQNNIVWDGVGTHCFTPFLDRNPACPPEARFKAISRGRPQAAKGLYVFQSPDGIHWTQIQKEPVITDGAFDSQNLAFWDPQIGKYREYHRKFLGGVRAIVTSVSDDFLHWSEVRPLEYVGAPNEHLYTNAILPHPRAAHLLIGFPTRYHPNRGSQVEPLLMASRDGQTFFRYADAVIPVTAPQDRMGNRSNYMSWGITPVQEDDQLEAVYATEAYYEGPDSRVRRFLYAKDRYASLHAPGKGEFTTKPLVLTGERLVVNHITTGSLRVELLDAETGKPLAGCGAEQCEPLQGDSAKAEVRWRGGTLRAAAGKPVRLRFLLDGSDVFGFQAMDAK